MSFLFMTSRYRRRESCIRSCYCCQILLNLVVFATPTLWCLPFFKWTRNCVLNVLQILKVPSEVCDCRPRCVSTSWGRTTSAPRATLVSVFRSISTWVSSTIPASASMEWTFTLSSADQVWFCELRTSEPFLNVVASHLLIQHFWSLIG